MRTILLLKRPKPFVFIINDSYRKYLLNARRIAPASVDVMRELKLLDRVEDKFHDTEMTMCKKMFQLQVSKGSNLFFNSK